MRRLLHGSWITLAALVLAIAGFLAWAGYTEPGLRTLATLASRRLGPIRLEIHGVRGTLARGFGADEVVVEQHRVRVEARGIEGRIALLPLFWQEIHVLDLHVADALVAVPQVPPDHKPWKPHILVGLLTIQVDRLRVDSAHLVVPSGVRLEASAVEARAALGLRDVRVDEGTLAFGGMQLRVAGNLHAAEPLGLAVQLVATRAVPGQAQWLARVRADGTLQRLPLAGEFEQPFQARFEGVAHDLTSAWSWEGKAGVQALDLRAFGASDVLGTLSGELQGGFARSGIHARGHALVPGLHTQPLALELDSGYAPQGLAIRRLELRDAPSGLVLQVAGDVRAPGGPLALALRGSFRSLRWPLADAAAALRVPQGRFTLAGQWPYRLQADGTLQLGNLPPMPAQADAQLAREQLTLGSLAVRAWGGEAQLHGALQWRAQPPWQLAGNVRHLDVAAVRPGFPGRLDFDVEARGTATDFTGRIGGVHGQVRGQPATGTAGFGHAGNDWLLQQVQLQLGGTHLGLDGRFGQRTELTYAIDASDLGLLAAGASGRLQARGRLRLGGGDPLWVGQLAGSDLRWDDLQVQRLSGEVDFDPAGSGHALATLEGRTLRWRDRQFERLSLASNGSAAAHRYSAELRGPSVHVQAGGSGRWEGERWHGQVEQFDAGDGADLRFALEAPAPVYAALDSGDFELGRMCLHAEAARLCAAVRSMGDARSLDLDAGNVPLNMLTAGLVGATDFAGKVTLALHGDAAAGAPWRGTLEATLAGAQASHHMAGGRTETFSIGDGQLKARLDDGGLLATAALRAGAQGSLDAELRAQPDERAWADWPLAGKLALQTRSLGFIDSYAAQVDRVSGRLDARVQLGGTLGAPALDGELKVADAQVDAYAYNIAVRDLGFTAGLHGTSLSLEGAFQAGTGGKASFDGALQWRDSLPWGQLHLRGTELRVANLPEARVLASPDVQLRFSGRRIDVTGTVDLPYARLQRPDQIASAVRSSADEVLVSKDAPPPGPAWKVFSDITLRLGERVTIDTLGLAGRLSGSLRSVTDESGFNRGTGELVVEEGKYTAYGRKLDIEHGKLQFNNGPLGDPAIDLRATKTFPDIRAGVNVRGTLRSPRMTFFSDPPVAQSQIVSLLLAGGSLETVQNTSDPGARGNSARNNMLLQGSAMLFQQLGNRVGLDDVSVESDLNNDTSLVLGRYLSPRLYVSYGVSLAEAINTIKMRYTIGDHWTIKTEAGAARSADLVFTVEH